MTIGSTTTKSGPYTANGVTTVFAYGFKIDDETHIEVVSTANNIDTVLTSGFTVSGVGSESGGSVTFTIPPSTGVITLVLNPPFLQSTDYQNQAAVQPEQVEDDFDLSVQRDLKLTEDISRSLKISVSDTAMSTALPALLPGQFYIMGTNELVAGDGTINIDDNTSVSVGSFAEIATSTKISAATEIVHVVDGYHGDGGLPFSMKKADSAPDHELWALHAVSNTYFEPLPVLGFLGFHVAGAKGKARYANAGGTERYEDSGLTVVAQNDEEPIQKVVDACIYSDSYRCNAWAPPGWYKLDDYIAVGHGYSFSAGLKVVGSGKGYRGEAQFGGSTFYKMYADAPAFNVQGARSPELCDFAIIGYIDTTNFDGGPSEYVFTESNWDAMVDLDGAAISTGRYNPDAGITLDAFSGSTATYTEKTPATWIEASPTSMNKSQSSDLSVTDVWISKVFCGVGIQVSNYDGNGDFTKLHKISGEKMKVAIAVCNTQSRNVSVRDCQFARVFYGIALNQFGRQTGNLGGEVVNLSVAGYCYRMYETDGSVFAGSTSWQNCFGESMYEIMNITSASSNDLASVWISCTFNMTGQDANGDQGVPTFIFRGTNTGRVHFIGGQITNFEALFGIELLNVRLDGTRTDSIMNGLDPVRPMQAMLWNATLGVVPDNTIMDTEHNITCRRFNIDTGVQDGQHECFNDGSFSKTGREFGVPLWVKRFRHQSDTVHGYVQRQRPIGLRERPKTDYSSITTDGDKITIVFNSTQSDNTAIQYGYTKGSLLTDEATRTVFLIEDWSGGDTIVAHALTNIEADETAVITGITKANPAVVTASNSFTNGQRVAIVDVAGMTDLNGGVYHVANRTASTFELQDLDGNNIDATGFGTYTSGGSAVTRQIKDTISDTTGKISTVQCGVYALKGNVLLDFVSGNTAVTAQTRGTNYDAAATDGITTSDFFWDGEASPHKIHSGAMSSVAAAASGSITMGTGGAQKSHSTLDQLFAREAA